MSSYEIRIHTDNAAFSDDSSFIEFARVLNKLADIITFNSEIPEHFILADLNGNNCGFIRRIRSYSEMLENEKEK